MSECIMKVIGRKHAPLKKTLAFILICTRNDLVWHASPTIEELHNIFKNASKILALVPSFPWAKLDSYENNYLDSLQEELSEFFYKLRYREDVLCHEPLQELLGIAQIPLPIEFISAIKVSEVFTLSSFFIVPSQKSIISSCEYVSMFKGIGKLWSLIETQSLGEVNIMGLDENLFKIAAVEVEEQIKCGIWLGNTFEALFGTTSGNVFLVRFRLKLSENSKGVFDSDKLSISDKKICKLHLQSIISLSLINDLIISISSDSVLKVSRCKITFRP